MALGKFLPDVETRFTGLTMSGGVALGVACLVNEDRHNALPVYRVAGDAQIEREIARLHEAVEASARRLDAFYQEVLLRIGKAEAEIFSAQKMILQDLSLRNRIVREIREGLNAEGAILRVFEHYEEKMRQVDNALIRERATDVGEMRVRLLDALRNMDPAAAQCRDDHRCRHARRRILVAEELTPGMTIDLDGDTICGFLTERGGRNSHAAILARAMGIPAVCGVQDIHRMVLCGTELLLDGATGEVVVWPSAHTLSQLKCELSVSPQMLAPAPPVAGYQVMANISLLSEIDDALRMEAEGIGLFRTEFAFMARGRALSEDEQYEMYAAALRAMDGRPVYFRLLDLGGDKPADFLNLPHEPNPCLGFRGSRLLLGQPALLRTQARALARASEFGPTFVMYPMIVDVNQFLALRNLFDEAVRGLPTENIRHGVMFEVPAACLQARELFEVADFGSIGTNDLTQYLYAVDRDNALVAYDYNPDRPAFWEVIRWIAEAAEASGKPLSVCGEMAGEGRLLPQLLNIGIRSISVSARLIPQLRQSLAQIVARG